MGKYYTSLLAAAVFLFPLDSFASEQIRQVQEELRKRLLFFNDLNGEYTPALATAIKRYQERKGFVSTGLIDREILASLGITVAAPAAGQVIASDHNDAVVHGPYGEALPVSGLAGAGHLGSAAFEQIDFDGDVPNQEHWAQEPDPPGEAVDATIGEEEDDAPFPIEFELTNERIHRNAKTARRTAIVLAPPAGAEWKIDTMDDDRAEKAGKPKRRARKAPRVRQRKETNPVVLAFQSVDRFMRNLFDGTPETKKRATPKRSSDVPSTPPRRRRSGETERQESGHIRVREAVDLVLLNFDLTAEMARASGIDHVIKRWCC